MSAGLRQLFRSAIAIGFMPFLCLAFYLHMLHFWIPVSRETVWARSLGHATLWKWSRITHQLKWWWKNRLSWVQRWLENQTWKAGLGVEKQIKRLFRTLQLMSCFSKTVFLPLSISNIPIGQIQNREFVDCLTMMESVPIIGCCNEHFCMNSSSPDFGYLFKVLGFYFKCNSPE